MRRLSYVAFVAIFALVLVASKGARTSTGVVILIFALLAAIALYFGTRDRSNPATVAERSFAATWLWLRRTLCFTLGVFCLWGGVYMALSAPSAKDFSYPVLNGLGLALFGAWVIYLGVYGQGRNRADLRDDLRLHADNKRRSRWWF